MKVIRDIGAAGFAGTHVSDRTCLAGKSSDLATDKGMQRLPSEAWSRLLQCARRHIESRAACRRPGKASVVQYKGLDINLLPRIKMTMPFSRFNELMPRIDALGASPGLKPRRVVMHEFSRRFKTGGYRRPFAL